MIRRPWPALEILSSVGGGPMERLAAALTARGHDARVRSAMPPERWRQLMSQGRKARLRARAETFLAWPLSAARAACQTQANVLVPTTNPFVLPWALLATRPLHGRLVVPLLYDMYPDALEASGLGRGAGLGGLASRLAVAANRWMFRRADGVVFIGKRMAEDARDRYGEPAAWTVLETGADPAEFASAALGDPAPRSDLERWCDGKLVVSYVGNLGLMHDVDTLRDAVRALVADPAVPQRLAFVIAASGPGLDVLKQAWADLPPDRVRFEAPLDDLSWARLLARSAVTVATLRESAKRTCVPSKAFSGLAASAALAVVAPRDSDVAELARKAGGFAVEPGDADGFAQRLADWARDPGALDQARIEARAAADRFAMDALAGRWVDFLREVRARRSATRRPGRAKRALDLLAASAGLALTAPLLAGAALGVRLTMGAPVLFGQDRPGLRGQVFKLKKFRTMRHPRPGEEGPEHDAARLTRFGRLLRATSVDELPTLLNVLRGDMSLVGPRPLLVRYLPRYSPGQARRHDVQPGVTGWAQVTGRNATTWDARFEQDLWYVDHQTFLLDLKILVLTVLKVVRREGISQEGHATMPEFTGQEADNV